MKRTLTPRPPPFYGLGEPTNRASTVHVDFAIPNRPNWYRRPDGTEYFREPPVNPPGIPARHTP